LEQSKFCRLSINSRLSMLTVGDSCATFHNLWKLYSPFVGSAWPTGQERVQVLKFNTRMEWIVFMNSQEVSEGRQVRPKWGHCGSDQWCVLCVPQYDWQCQAMQCVSLGRYLCYKCYNSVWHKPARSGRFLSSHLWNTHSPSIFRV
jgi:hypothetical protein